MVRKSRFIKGVIIFVLALGVLVAAGAWGLNWMMNRPLYVFGSVQTAENLRGPLQPPEQTDVSKKWQVEQDIELSFDSWGEGEPILVVHGGPGIPYGAFWNGLDSLKTQYKFYFYHQRGCGNSTRPFDRFEGNNFYNNMLELEKTLGLGAQIADIERIRRILNRDKITLVGHSYGGFIAMLYAAEFPDRVKKLILVAPAGVLTPPDKERNLFELARAKLDPTDQSGLDKVTEEYFDFGSIFSKSESDLVDVHMRLGQYLLPAMGYASSEVPSGPRSGGWAVFALYFSCGRAQDYRPALLEITAPTLIIHGADDTISLAGARTYEPIRNSQFVMIEKENADKRAGHFIFNDSPIKFSKVVSEFLSK